MLPVLQIGPVAVPVPGLLILLALWFGLSLAEKMAPRFGIKPDMIYTSIGLGLISGLIGARVSFVGLHLDAFIKDPRAAISLNYQLMDFWGGIVFAGIAILIYGVRNRLNWYQYFDALTPFIAVIFVAFSLAQLANGTGYGVLSNLPWAINLWGASRHPTQIYDFLASAGILIWLILSTRNQWNRIGGLTFLRFVALTSISRVIMHGFLADTEIVFGHFRSSQVSAWIVLVLSVISIFILNRKENSPNIDASEPT